MKKLILITLITIASSLSGYAQCNVAGGTISTPTNGDAAITRCEKNSPVPITLSQNEGPNSIYLVFNGTTGIIEILTTNSNINFDNLPGGAHSIRHLSYEDGISGLEIGEKWSDISGCFEFSNGITVTKFSANPGVIELESGGTETSICSNKIVSVARTPVLAESHFWCYTDAQGNIIDFLDSNQLFLHEVSFDFTNTPAGEYRIYSGGAGIVEFFVGFDLNIGDNIDDDNPFCIEFSNPIAVTIESTCNDDDDESCNVSGGVISTPGLTVTCENESPISVSLSQNTGSNSVFVVIKQGSSEFEIITTNSNISFDGLSSGVHRIQHLSYEDGLSGLAIGEKAFNLSGCFDYSTSLSITKFNTNPGVIALESGGTETSICSNKTVSVVRNDSNAEAKFWFHTDIQGNIIDFKNINQSISDETSFDFSNTPAGEYLIYSGGSGAVEFFPGFDIEIGENINDNNTFCLEFSNPITVTIEAGCDNGDGDGDDDDDDDPVDPPVECTEVTDNITCNGKNKVVICRNNVSVCVPSKKASKEIDNGATLGACTRCIEGTAKNASAKAQKTTEIAEFSLFPNPSTDQITITSNSEYNGKLYVYSPNGQLILNKTMESNSRLELKFSDYNMKSGLYFIRVATEKGSTTKAFIIK